MIDRLNEVVFQTLVAAMAVEALLRFWNVRTSAQKVRLRTLVLLVPLALQPAFALAAPFRQAEEFAERTALFAVQRWAALDVLGLGLDRLWLGACALLGLLLLFADLVPWARKLANRRRGLRGGVAEPPEVLRQKVRRRAAKLGFDAPAVTFLDSPRVVLACTGIRTPRVIVSRGAVELLDEEELEAALAHELAHLARADVLLGWALMAARLLQAFNPAVHVVARAIARDVERRADDAACASGGRRLALASALVKVVRATTSTGLFHRAHQADVEGRCRRLLDGPAPPEEWARGQLWATAALLAGGLFFVT